MTLYQIEKQLDAVKGELLDNGIPFLSSIDVSDIIGQGSSTEEGFGFGMETISDHIEKHDTWCYRGYIVLFAWQDQSQSWASKKVAVGKGLGYMLAELKKLQNPSPPKKPDWLIQHEHDMAKMEKEDKKPKRGEVIDFFVS